MASSHLTNIPEAVRIAASVHDASIDAGIKQQAIDYLEKVKELCEETWQVRYYHDHCSRERKEGC